MSALRLAEEFPPYIARSCPLTRRQVEFVWLLGLGHNYGSIGKHAHVAYSTVRGQLDAARARAGCRTNEELVGLAVRNGWI